MKKESIIKLHASFEEIVHIQCLTLNKTKSLNSEDTVKLTDITFKLYAEDCVFCLDGTMEPLPDPKEIIKYFANMKISDIASPCVSLMKWNKETTHAGRNDIFGH